MVLLGQYFIALFFKCRDKIVIKQILIFVLSIHISMGSGVVLSKDLVAANKAKKQINTGNDKQQNKEANNLNLVIITIDGLRWQEVFEGADANLINNEKFVKNVEGLTNKYWNDDVDQRKKLLMPFLWNTINRHGVIVGDRSKQSKMSVSNIWYFSYPGYNEIFTGIADPEIDSNHKKLNANVSFLEWLNNQPDFNNKVAAFASWDVFPYIFNIQRSHFYLNAGFATAKGKYLDKKTKFLNELQSEIPSPWHNVRLDAFTYEYAFDYLTKFKPRVLAISFGETDDFAHDGRYDQYLDSAHRTDKFINNIWNKLQNMKQYKNNTVMIITTDHGRGQTVSDWQHHASKKATQGYLKALKKFPEGIVGSNQIWMAAIGPGVKSSGLIKTNMEIKQKQIAPTALKLLHENPDLFLKNHAKVISAILSSDKS